MSLFPFLPKRVLGSGRAEKVRLSVLLGMAPPAVVIGWVDMASFPKLLAFASNPF